MYNSMRARILVLLLLLFIKTEISTAKIVLKRNITTPIIIYGITPTYWRLTQKADLVRLSQTLMHVKNFHWIVVEDAERKSKLVTNLLKESTLNYTHLNAKTKRLKKYMGKGVEQRNEALSWLRRHLQCGEKKRGVVYFMDDDNTYSLKLFDEIRKVKRVGVWPVGIAGGMRVESPIVVNGKVIGFNSVWEPKRKFPIDMAAFAINADLFLLRKDAAFKKNMLAGFQESIILEYFTTPSQMEPLADNCTKVYVWHTQTVIPTLLGASPNSTTTRKSRSRFARVRVGSMSISI